MDGWNWLTALMVALLSYYVMLTSSETVKATNTKCNLAQFQCSNGTCIPSNKYCDGSIDCIDGSDETKLCSACNRTYYGETGKTYEVEIQNQPNSLPLICHLNFTAPGGNFGDIVQLNFIKFNVGRFIPNANDECIDGYMIITEQGLPKLNGKWCGMSWGYTIYYSETRSVNLSLRLDNIIQQSVGNNFEFKIIYKFLKKTDAKLRYDGGIFTGDLVAGTYCNRNFNDCDKRICRIRSPNYPGIYPRNLTCKYHINHRTPPNGLHAMIVLRQPDGHKLNIKEQATNYEQSNRILRSWDQCETDQDYLSIRDGKTTESPELARLCGGDVLPDVTSSGPDMLVQFKTSGHDTPFHPVPVSFLPGFELQVHVLFVNANTQSYVRQPGRCEFVLSAFESQTGELESPQHTLPPDSVCLYHFQGRRHETVWISFIKYHSVQDPTGFEPPSECVTQLRIWDGRWMISARPYGVPSESTRNASLIEQICREEVPRLCVRSLVAKGSRPCSTKESYLSTGPDLTIEYRPSPIGTARLYGPEGTFKLRYEFVDNSLGGAPLEPLPGPSAMPEPAALVQFHTKSCDRVFRSNVATRGIFRSPSNVFLYGRGGSQNISCTMRFEASPGESVRLTITRARFGGRPCQNMQNRSGRWHCNYLSGPVSHLRISEIPWPDISPLPRDCMCSDVSGSITLAPLAASIVEVHFTTFEMGVDQDFRDFYFEGRYEFARDGCETDWSERRLRGQSGNAILKQAPCPPVIQPWLVEPETHDAYLVLKLKGFWMPTVLQSAPPCPTDERITIYSTNNPKNSRDLCPYGSDVVAFSDGWDNPSETFEYKFSWMEVFPGTECPYKCPELQACIPATLWCDGHIHCPSGYDESSKECDLRMPLTPLHVGIGAATLTLFFSLIAGLTACARRKRVEKKHHLHHHQSSTATLAASGPNHLHHVETNGRYPTLHTHHPHHHLAPHHVLPQIYLDSTAKDSFC